MLTYRWCEGATLTIRASLHYVPEFLHSTCTGRLHGLAPLLPNFVGGVGVHWPAGYLVPTFAASQLWVHWWILFHCPNGECEEHQSMEIAEYQVAQQQRQLTSVWVGRESWTLSSGQHNAESIWTHCLEDAASRSDRSVQNIGDL